MSVTDRIAKLRKLMEERKMDAYIIPSADNHQSEYVGEHFKARAFISGFTGSAGTVIITKDDAGLWTDGRYFIQAEKQLEGSGIRLFRMAEPDVPPPNWNVSVKKCKKLTRQSTFFLLLTISHGCSIFEAEM